jgi:DNA polymerase-4
LQSEKFSCETPQAFLTPENLFARSKKFSGVAPPRATPSAKFERYLLDITNSEPLIMHIDLNSCFASCEQQARPMLRGRPVAISNRASVNSAIVTASYEAKARGVKVGMRRLEALAVCPELIFVEAEPCKYRYVYTRLMGIMREYSPEVTMTSIDEGVIDFRRSTRLLKGRSLTEIGLEIKRRLREEVGCYMRCNVGIGCNRFWAKTAAGLHKPDGMDVITRENLVEVFGGLKLTDLTGIGKAMERRLNAVGIYTPLEFLAAEEATLRRMVFMSKCGTQWYWRLRGHEVDERTSEVQSVGRQYVLESNRLTREETRQRLFHLCEEVGARLRSKERVARGIYVYVRTHGGEYWHRCRKFEWTFFTDKAIWNLAGQLFRAAPADIREIGVSCYGVERPENRQLSLFYDELAREERVQAAVDAVNTRFGARTMHAAETLATRQVRTKIPFGSTRYL